MRIYRYSEWDGSQDIPGADADELMDELGRHLMSYGDLSYALRLLQRAGFRDNQGRRLPGIQELLQRLRQQRQERLDKYKLSSILDEIREKLDDILKTEREGIQRKRDEVRQRTGQSGGELSPEMRDRLLKAADDSAAQHRAPLVVRPDDVTAFYSPCLCR